MDIEIIEKFINKLAFSFTTLNLKQLAKKLNISFYSGKLLIEIMLGFYLSDKSRHQLIESWEDEIRLYLNQMNQKDIVQIKFDIKMEVSAHQTQEVKAKYKNIKNIILIASGKGGVGKSTVTANLALALKAQGANVGILDADIYGPSQPQILGNYQAPTVTEEKRLMPLQSHGIYMMSIGNLVNLDSAMIWRGPMVSQALRQLLNDTLWPELDYLLIDLPPGTGDIQLTIAKEVPVAGSLVVTTPQDLALLDARRAVEMFQKVKITILGIVENMSTFICSHCGHEEAIFGQAGGTRLAGQLEIPLLGQIPLAMAVRENTDNGKPIVIAEPDNIISLSYEKIALAMSAYLSLKRKNYSASIPDVKIEFSKE